MLSQLPFIQTPKKIFEKMNGKIKKGFKYTPFNLISNIIDIISKLKDLTIFLESLKLRHIFIGLMLFSPVAALLIWNGQIALVGGFLLIIASFFVYTGQIFYSVFIYFVADIAWVVIAFQSGNVLGGSMVFIGMVLGVLAWLKMNYGQMRKNLSW